MFMMDPNDGADDNHSDDFVVVIWGIKGSGWQT